MSERISLTEYARIMSDSRKAALAAQTFPVATSPAKPLELSQTKELSAQSQSVVEQDIPSPATQPTSSNEKTAEIMDATKSGDQYFPIIVQPGSTPAPTDPNAKTPSQTTSQIMMWGFGAISFLILVIWLLNRKPA